MALTPAVSQKNESTATTESLRGMRSENHDKPSDECDDEAAKLKAARDRKREANGKCEGRKSYAEGMPETVALAK